VRVQVQHGLSSAAGAPLLSPADDPDRLPALRYVEGLLAAAGAWLAWALAVGLVRAWRWAGRGGVGPKG
jgi:hypothetical protein